MKEIIKDNSKMTSVTSFDSSQLIPNELYGVLPYDNDVAFPYLSGHFRVTSDYKKNFFDNYKVGDLFVIAKSNKDNVYENLNQLILPGVALVGTLCRISSIDKGEVAYNIGYDGLIKVDLDSFDLNALTRVVVCRISEKKDLISDSVAVQGFLSRFISTYEKHREKYKSLPDLPDFRNVNSDEIPFQLANFINCSAHTKQGILECVSTTDRYRILINELEKFNQDAKIEHEINVAVSSSMDRAQREYILREKMKAIKNLLSEFDGDDSDAKYEKAIKEHPDLYPEVAQKQVREELNKLKTMPAGSQEASVVKSYLDLIIKLPWNISSIDNEDLTEVKKILDEDHYGLVKQKERVMEYLAVKSMTKSLKAPILCLYGPPGVGKTSLAISIARALGRKFEKISLGGISDESEIRGHRRTYIASMPGKIINTIQRAGVNNPLILLDEIDKINGGGYHGDPASALLEVLDPEQNTSFNDNYLDLPFDLSHVLFICTANDLSKIPTPLLDRLELIELNTYTKYEKINIAKNHLIKQEQVANGLKDDMVHFTDESLDYLIEGYTREAGVRELRRKIGTVMRKFAVNYLIDNSKNHLEVDNKVIEEMLGKPIFSHMDKDSVEQVGVINGLAYTEYGGEVLKIEVNTFKGTGRLNLTGKLGDVMKEACSAALSYIHSSCEKWGINPEWFNNNDIHIHFPEGAVPKDGPSAGVATACVLLSAITNEPLKADVAMTGETDLRGASLPIGGLREKTLAAVREHMRLVLVPEKNHKDVLELPKEVLDNLQIVEVNSVEEVIPYVFVNDIYKDKDKIFEFTSKNIKKTKSK